MATTKITSPDLFDLGSLNTALQLPSGTTAERPTSPSTGEWRYNTTTNLVEFWDGGAWRDLQSEDIPPTPSEHFNTVLYTGTGSAQSITGVGFKPDIVWIKDRIQAYSHNITDTSRGINKQVFPNNTNAQETYTNRVTSFDADGFTIGNDNYVNTNGNTFVAWCWKANGGTTSSNTDGTNTSTVQVNTKAGFSIVSYTGTGNANMSYGHGLSTTPNLMIIKSLNTGEWCAFGPPIFERMNLNDTAADQNNFGVTATSTTIETTQTSPQEGNVAWNGSGVNYISYCFASVAGYSSIGSYTGNGSTNGPIVNTGFEPAFIMFKQTDDVANWCIVDNKRSTTNPRNKTLRANSDVSEATVGSTQLVVDFLSNGFQLKQAGGNNVNGGTYIYMAFASDPSAAPVLPDSFGVETYQGNGGTQSLAGYGFTPSMIWFKARTVAYDHGLYDRVRGGGSLIYPNLTQAASTVTNGVLSFDSSGVTIGANNKQNASDSTYVGWAWKANPAPTINTDGTIQSLVSANANSGFSIVKYEGNSTAGTTIGHGLSAVPQMIIVKRLESPNDNWAVYNETIGNTKRLSLDESGAAASNRLEWNSTTPSATTFTLGNHSAVNTNSSYIAYCFHSISGFSKIGSYAGTGSSGNAQNIGFQPDFVLGKSYDNPEDWFIVDSVRGGNKYLRPNTSAVEATAGASITFTSTGFQFTGGSFNNSGMNFIYMAFKENPGTPAAIPAGEVAYLVIAAGGGAGGVGGGGGAGGLRTSYGNYTGGGQSAESNITLSAQTYTITIGAGGTASATGGAFNNDGNTGSNGTSSVFGTITSLGGGGGTGGGNTALSGGSGGGCRSGRPGSGTYGQGFDGATGDIGGGGGGAGGAGLSSTAGSCGANGGPGLNVPITGATTFYAGGGAGGVSFASGCSASSGGIGGGGDAGANAGTANTGGGGGGGSWTNNANYTTQGGGNGGSGAVILRMNTSDYSGTTTGSPTVTTSGSETILTYTGSGTYVHS